MQNEYRGLMAALAAVVLLGSMTAVSGCARRQELYLAGLESELAAVPDGELREKRQDHEADASDAKTAQNSKSVQAEWQDHGADASDARTAQNSESEQDEFCGYVQVSGAVRAPGVYPIREDMRVFEVIAQAGGCSEEADEEWLNQAERVADGQKIYVYSKDETAKLKEDGQAAYGSGPDSGGKAQVQSQKVNLNTADKETLMTLPGIGEAKADAILAYREQNGGFGSIEEIQNISGIKTAVFSKIKDQITVD